MTRRRPRRDRPASEGGARVSPIRRRRAAPLVAVINTNDDLVSVLRAQLEAHGYTVATLHIADVKSGRKSFTAFVRRHEPDVIVYDLAVPYDDNWTFLQTLRRLPESQGRPYVLTTVNKAALEERVGKTDTIEIRGGRADDLEPTLDAVRRALHATPADEDRLLGRE